MASPTESDGGDLTRSTPKEDDEPDVPIDPEEIWVKVLDPEADDKLKGDEPEKVTPTERRGWKTIRIFVSSTEWDFHYERDLLVKKVFPELRKWCEERRLHLVDCDLRWGVPEQSPDEKVLRACLEEIDRCKAENQPPFFIGMTSERVGWVPEKGEVHKNISEKYRWVFGLSLTEMEIVHGAYRDRNINAIFLIRSIDDKFLDQLHRKDPALVTSFQDVEKEKNAKTKQDFLKGEIVSRFHATSVVKYECDFARINPVTKKVDLNTKLTDEPNKKLKLEDKILQLLKDRIQEKYPLFELSDDPLIRQQEQHETFMKGRADVVLGRDDLIEEIVKEMSSEKSTRPIVLVGEPGSGKSSVMAKVADTLCQMAEKQTKLVFYHFVGAVPESHDLVMMLQRLLSLMGLEEGTSNDLPVLTQACCSALSNPNTPQIHIVVDAINQFDDSPEAENVSWLPTELSDRASIIVSTIGKTTCHKQLTRRLERDEAGKQTEFDLPNFNLRARLNIIESFFRMYNKELTMHQMVDILDKDDSWNPMWLKVACEEMRIWGDKTTLSNRIEELPNTLLMLLRSVFGRFDCEMGDNGYLIKATMCLLETSRTGLRENELRDLLYMEYLEKEKSGSANLELTDEKLQLPAMTWREIFIIVGPFLRPYGEYGEGRLDFYHRILSKMVIEKYLTDDKTRRMTKKTWHEKLANYFEGVTDKDRQMEEYPYHLVKIGDKKRLAAFVSDWDVFDKLYDEELSVKLLKYWRESGDQEYKKMTRTYLAMLQELAKDSVRDKQLLTVKYLEVGRILLQAGKLGDSESLEVAKAANRMSMYENIELGPNEEISIKSLFAEIYAQRHKLKPVDAKNIPDIRCCLQYHDQAITRLRELDMTNDKNKTRLGAQLLKKASMTAALVDVVGATRENEQEDLKGVKEALDIFTKLRNDGKRAEAMLQQADLMNLRPAAQLQTYRDALALSYQTYGKFHILSSQINKNLGICAEDIATDFLGQGRPQSDAEAYYEIAYGHFRNYYDINIRIYGKKHSKTKQAIDFLMEKTYRRIADKKGDTLNLQV